MIAFPFGEWMDTYLYAALTRLRSVSTIQRAFLLHDKSLLLALRSGKRTPDLHPILSKAAANLDWARCEREDRRAEATGVVLLSWDHPDYPELLRSLPDPPPALYLKGSVRAIERPALAIVGSRLSTVYGQNVARMFGEEAAHAGLTVVSGLARGIDTAAHRGSLKVPGSTAGVLGTGIDVPYPAENEGLIREIVEKGGAVLTEFPPGTPPMPRNFPVRNRVIAGLVWGVLVVEATERSGSLITARFALETGRELFAVPHNITSRTGIGPNTLIQRGAKLVQQVGDLLEELPEHLRCNLKQHLSTTPGASWSEDGSPPDFSEKAARIFATLKPDEAMGVDALCGESGLTASEALSALLELQMAGACVELPGARYARKSAKERT